MKALEAAELLSAWEKGLNQPLLQRALILLSVASPGLSGEALLQLSIGQRDHRLLQLRETLFGTRLSSTAVCPGCNERLEWENQTTDFLSQCDAVTEKESEFILESDEYFVRFRLPNSLDLASVADNEDFDVAQHALLSACILEANIAGNTCTFSQLPGFIVLQLTERIETLDTLADIHISLDCPECSHQWSALFDIASFLWQEVNDWAEQMLQVVYRLAVGYGWSEEEILHISPVRRQLYLGMLGS